MRKFHVRTMKASEHTDQSWEALFGLDENTPSPNYAVVDNEERVFSLGSTYAEACEEADNLNAFMEDEAAYQHGG